MIRKIDWEERLFRLVGRAYDAKFRWGEFDCCLFACNAIRVMTGEDPAAGFRGKYRTKASARKALREIGAGDLAGTVEALAETFKAPEVRPRLARRGDLVLADLLDGPSLGVCLGAVFAVPDRESGLVMLDMEQALRAWRIG